MNLSNILFNNISNKLKLTLLEKEKFYTKNLFYQINQLEENKKNFLKKLSQKKNNYNLLEENLTVYYIINITFLKTNTAIHLSDIKGNTKLFYSTGDVGLKGKQKKKRRIVISKLISLLIKKVPFINKKPVALHLNNVKFYKKLIIKRLKKNIFIKIIKSFNLAPYNGCRKKKIRRKKRTKIFK